MTAFSELIGALRADGDTYRVEITEDWQQGRTTFGGLTSALCLAAAERAVPDLPPLRSAQFTFIGPVGGSVSMTPRLLRRGKSSAFVAVELNAEGALGAHAMLSFAASRESSISYRSHPIPEVPAPGTTKPFLRSAKPNFMQHFEAFVAGGYRLCSNSPTPEIVSWMRHRDPAAMAMLPGVIAIADTLPAGAYTMLAQPAPSSSISWSVEMIDAAAAQRASGDSWYLLRSAGEDVRDGYSVQTMSVWAQDGTLIMLSRQTVAIFG